MLSKDAPLHPAVTPVRRRPVRASTRPATAKGVATLATRTPDTATVFVGSPPAWARGLIARHGSGRVAELRWRRSASKTFSSGRAWYRARRLVVTADIGGDRSRDARWVLLHEIAHLLAPGGHTAVFHDTLYALAQRENLVRYGATRAGDGRGQRAAARRASFSK